MKFYYEGKLIRTSKTHNYTHATINVATGLCKGCSSTKEGAERLISTPIAENLEGIENCKAILKALESGKKMYRCKDGRRSYYISISDTTYYNVENVNRWIAERDATIEYIKKNYKVVELEAR